MSLKIDKKRILLSITAILAFIKTSPDKLPATSIIPQIISIIGSLEYGKKSVFESLKKDLSKELMNLFDYLNVEQCDSIVEECFSSYNVEEYIIEDKPIIRLAGNLKSRIIHHTSGSETYDMNFINNNEDYEAKADILLGRINKIISENETLREFQDRVTGAQTLSLVIEINSQLKQVLEQIAKPNSAYMWHMPKTNSIDREIFRFHYSAENVHLHDRDDEILRLKEFCGYDKDLIRSDEAPNFQWWLITGAGGTGKSRLAYEFSNIMEKADWTVCYPYNNKRLTLEKCSEDLPNDTLFVLDYTEMDLADIGEWMVSFGTRKYSNIRVRIILIQRFAENLDSLRLSKNPSEKNFIKNSLGGNGEFLKLDTISDENLKHLMMDYTKSKISVSECNTLLEILCEVDKLKRPLFALACADAYLDGVKINNQYDLLNYICDKEYECLCGKVKRIFNDKADEWISIAQNIYIMATMVGRVDIDLTLRTLLPDDYLELNKQSNENRKRFFRNTGLFYFKDNSVFCDPIEPDIIGEYYVLKNIVGKEEFIGYAWAVPYYMSRFVTRLYQDFGERLSEIKEYIDHAKVPKHVKNIDNAAFLGCASLKSIELHENIFSIGTHAFSGCHSLFSVKIPNGVETIGNAAFQNCTELEYVEMNDSVVKIGDSIFSDCQNLKEVKLSNKLSIISVNAFYACASLKAIKLPTSLTTIDDGAFGDCANLEMDELPPSVQRIGRAAFSYCAKLKHITIPRYVKRVSEFLFSGCTMLKSVVLPDTIESIGECAFFDCPHLEFVVFPDNLAVIDNSAFARCIILEVNRIPDSIKQIGRGAFAEAATPYSIQLLKTFCSINNIEFEPIVTLDEHLVWGTETHIRTGTVKFYNSQKGFGIIHSYNSSSKSWDYVDIFVHFSSIVSDGYKVLDEGQKVRFQIQCDPNDSSRIKAGYVVKV